MLFGISEAGAVWALGSDYITEHPKEFMRISMRIFPWLFSSLPFVWCFLDTENTVHSRWLHAMGFRPIPHSRTPNGFETYYLNNV